MKEVTEALWSQGEENRKETKEGQLGLEALEQFQDECTAQGTVGEERQD